MLEGLRRLIANHCHFTISQRAKDNVTSAVRDANNILDFLDSEGYVAFKADYEASTKNLYAAYKRWCEDNAENPLSPKSFANQLSQNVERYHWSRSTIYTSAVENGAGDIWAFMFCSHLWSCNGTSKLSVRAFIVPNRVQPLKRRNARTQKSKFIFIFDSSAGH